MNLSILKSKNLLYVYEEENEKNNVLNKLSEIFNDIICENSHAIAYNDYFANSTHKCSIDLVLIDITQSINIIDNIRNKNKLIPIFLICKNINKYSINDFINQSISYCLSDFNDFDNLLKKMVFSTKSVIRRRFSAYFDEVAIIIRTNKNNEIIYANKRFSKISGYKESEYIGQNHELFKNKTPESRISKEIKSELSYGNIWNGIVKNEKKDGTVYYVNESVFPIYDDVTKDLIETLSIKFLVTTEEEQISKLKKYIINQKSKMLHSNNDISIILKEQEKKLNKNFNSEMEKLTQLAIELEKDLKQSQKEKAQNKLLTSSLEKDLKNLKEKDENDFFLAHTNLKNLKNDNIVLKNEFLKLEKTNESINAKLHKSNINITTLQSYIDEYRLKIENLHDVIKDNEAVIEELKKIK